MKHGPLALVDSDMPVISIAPNDQLIDKPKSDLKEVQARGGELYVFADKDSEFAESEEACISCACQSITANSRLSCNPFRYSCFPTMQRWSRGRMWISRVIWLNQ